MTESSERRTLRKMLTVTGILVVLVIASFVWAHFRDEVPTVRIPAQTLPSPNGYDFYANLDKVQDGIKIGFAIENTAPHKSAYGPEDRVYSLAEKEALLAENLEVLTDVREGLKYPCVIPRLRTFGYSLRAQTWSQSARLFVLESQVRAGHKDFAGAMNSCLDATQFGVECSHGGMGLTNLVALWVARTGRKPAWGIIDKLGDAEAKAAVRRMEKILDRQVPYPNAIEDEKWSTVGMLVDAMNRPNAQAMLENLAIRDPDAVWESAWDRIRLRTASRKAIVFNYTRCMDQYALIAKGSYATRPPLPPEPGDPINHWLLEGFERLWVYHINDFQTQNSLLTVALALRAYKVMHGQYPASLRELAPTYLKRLPDDPFAASGTLGYRRIGAKYVLYSVGPDGKDDKGKPIYVAAMRSNAYRVEGDSKGDIVAGVNSD